MQHRNISIFSETKQILNMARVISYPLQLCLVMIFIAAAPVMTAPYLKTETNIRVQTQAQLPLDHIFTPSQGLIGPLFRQNDHSANPPTHGGCYYQFNHYDEGDRIITNEPCLNCTCHNSMLMCYLKVCPFSKPPGSNCTFEMSPDQCCPVITCPQVPVDLQVMEITSTTTLSPSSSTSLTKYVEHGCTIDKVRYSDGAQVPGDPKNPCQLCYCIRNHTACVMQECTLKVEGCQPVFEDGICCPIRYKCDYYQIEGEVTTTLSPDNETLITTTLLPTATGGCQFEGEFYADGASIVSSDDPCEHCYCMKGDVVCAVQECTSPLDEEEEHCAPRPSKPGQCCPEAYDCPDTTPVAVDTELTALAAVGLETTTQKLFAEEEEEKSTEKATSVSISEEDLPVTESIEKEADVTEQSLKPVTVISTIDVVEDEEGTDEFTKSTESDVPSIETRTTIPDAEMVLTTTPMPDDIPKLNVSILVETMPATEDPKPDVEIIVEAVPVTESVDAPEIEVEGTGDFTKSPESKEPTLETRTTGPDDDIVLTTTPLTDAEMLIPVTDKATVDELHTPKETEVEVTTHSIFTPDKLPSLEPEVTDETSQIIEDDDADVITTDEHGDAIESRTTIEPEQYLTESTTELPLETLTQEPIDSPKTKPIDTAEEKPFVSVEGEPDQQTDAPVDYQTSTLEDISDTTKLPVEYPTDKPIDDVSDIYTTKQPSEMQEDIDEEQVDFTTEKPKEAVEKMPVEQETDLEIATETISELPEDDEDVSIIIPEKQPEELTTKISEADIAPTTAEVITVEHEKETTDVYEEITTPTSIEVPTTPVEILEPELEIIPEIISELPEEDKELITELPKETDHTTDSPIDQEIILPDIETDDVKTPSEISTASPDEDLLTKAPESPTEIPEKDYETEAPESVTEPQAEILEDSTPKVPAVALVTEITKPEIVDETSTGETIEHIPEIDIVSIITDAPKKEFIGEITIIGPEQVPEIELITTIPETVEFVPLTTEVSTDQVITEIPDKETTEEEKDATTSSSTEVSTPATGYLVPDKEIVPEDISELPEDDEVEVTDQPDIEPTKTPDILTDVTTQLSTEQEIILPDDLETIDTKLPQTESPTDAETEIPEDVTELPDGDKLETKIPPASVDETIIEMTTKPEYVDEVTTEEATKPETVDVITIEEPTEPETVDEKEPTKPETVDEISIEEAIKPEIIDDVTTEEALEQVTTAVPDEESVDQTQTLELDSSTIISEMESDDVITLAPVEAPAKTTAISIDDSITTEKPEIEEGDSTFQEPEIQTEEDKDPATEASISKETLSPTDLTTTSSSITESIKTVTEYLEPDKVVTPEVITEYDELDVTKMPVKEQTEIPGGLVDYTTQVPTEHEIKLPGFGTELPDAEQEETTDLSQIPDVTIDITTEAPTEQETIQPDFETEVSVDEQEKSTELPEEEQTEIPIISSVLTTQTPTDKEIILPDAPQTESPTDDVTEIPIKDLVTEKPEDVTEPQPAIELPEDDEDITIEAITQPPETTTPPKITDDIATIAEPEIEISEIEADAVEPKKPEEATSATIAEGIPGEGNCLLKEKTYANEEIVHITSPCQEECRCKNSKISCQLKACPSPPPAFLSCNPIQNTEECCPSYECPVIEAESTASPLCIRDGQQYLEGERVMDNDPCTDCYCINGEISCALHACPALANNCKANEILPNTCCPSTHECSGLEIENLIIGQTTTQPDSTDVEGTAKPTEEIEISEVTEPSRPIDLESSQTVVPLKTVTDETTDTLTETPVEAQTEIPDEFEPYTTEKYETKPPISQVTEDLLGKPEIVQIVDVITETPTEKSTIAPSETSTAAIDEEEIDSKTEFETSLPTVLPDIEDLATEEPEKQTEEQEVSITEVPIEQQTKKPIDLETVPETDRPEVILPEVLQTTPSTKLPDELLTKLPEVPTDVTTTDYKEISTEHTDIEQTEKPAVTTDSTAQFPTEHAIILPDLTEGEVAFPTDYPIGVVTEEPVKTTGSITDKEEVVTKLPIDVDTERPLETTGIITEVSSDSVTESQTVLYTKIIPDLEIETVTDSTGLPADSQPKVTTTPATGIQIIELTDLITTTPSKLETEEPVDIATDIPDIYEKEITTEVSMVVTTEKLTEPHPTKLPDEVEIATTDSSMIAIIFPESHHTQPTVESATKAPTVSETVESVDGYPTVAVEEEISTEPISATDVTPEVPTEIPSGGIFTESTTLKSTVTEIIKVETEPAVTDISLTETLTTLTPISVDTTEDKEGCWWHDNNEYEHGDNVPSTADACKENCVCLNGNVVCQQKECEIPISSTVPETEDTLTTLSPFTAKLPVSEVTELVTEPAIIEMETIEEVTPLTSVEIAVDKEGVLEGCWWFDGNEYNHGDSIPSNDLCQEHCSCFNGTVKCQHNACDPAPPSSLQCTEIISDNSCCPRYDCAPLPSDLKCIYNGIIYEDAASIPFSSICQNCFCLQGKVVCAQLECEIPHKDCIAIVQRDNECCASVYECSEQSPPPETFISPSSPTEEKETTAGEIVPESPTSPVTTTISPSTVKITIEDDQTTLLPPDVDIEITKNDTTEQPALTTELPPVVPEILDITLPEQEIESDQPEADDDEESTIIDAAQVTEGPKIIEEKVTDEPIIIETKTVSEGIESDIVTEETPITETEKATEEPKIIKVTEEPIAIDVEKVTEEPAVVEQEKTTEETPEISVTEEPKIIETEDDAEEPIVTETEKITEQPKIVETETESDVPTIEADQVTEEPTFLESEKVPEKPTIVETEVITEVAPILGTEKITEEPEIVEMEIATKEPVTTELEDGTEKPTIIDTGEAMEDPSVMEKEKVSEEPTITEPEKITEEPVVTGTEQITEEPTIIEVTTEKPATIEAEKMTERPFPPFPDTTHETGLPYGPPDASIDAHPSHPNKTTDIVLGPGSCLFDGKVYVSAQQIPRDDPCDFCFCFRSDIICLQQSCPPPIPGCYEEAIKGFCCPRYQCPVKQAVIEVTTTTTPFPSLLPLHKTSRETFCEVEGQFFAVGHLIQPASSDCHQCICSEGGTMKCLPKECSSHRKLYRPQQNRPQQTYHRLTDS